MPNSFNKINIDSLSLRNFRNYKSIDFEFKSNFTVFTGENGIGKTNILEAISFLSPGKGLRYLNKIDEANYQHQDSWFVSALLTNLFGQSKIVTSCDKQKKKRHILLNDKAITKQAELAKLVSMNWLTPQMDGLFIGSSSRRRKFLDKIVSNFYPDHDSHIYIYEDSMRQRAKLLQEYADPLWIKILEDKMAQKAIAIAAARIETIQLITQDIENTKSNFPKAQIKIIGFVEDLLSKHKALEAEEIFKEKLFHNRITDKNSKRTGSGIHLSDIEVSHQANLIKAAFCSTGEQKALLINILLAEIRTKIAWQNTVPILLLDEIIAHLDENRRKSLFSDLLELNCQVFTTGIKPEAFDFIANYATILRL